MKYNYKVNSFSYKLNVGQNLNLNKYIKLEKGLKELIDNDKISNNSYYLKINKVSLKKLSFS